MMAFERSGPIRARAEAGTALREPVSAADVFGALYAFTAQGAVHLRGAVGAAQIEGLRRAAADVFAERAALARAGRLPEALRVPHLRRFVSLSDLDGGRELLRELLHPAFVAVASAYLGKAPQTADDIHVRSVTPLRADVHLPFHQDETILRRRLLNVWIPLAECGVDAPGLELVTGSWRVPLPLAPLPGARYAAERAALDAAELIRRCGAGALWRPVCEPGDALLFAGTTAHRTHATPAMTRDRASVELRLV